jgi:hypothetical protein
MIKAWHPPATRSSEANATSETIRICVHMVFSLHA